MAIMMAIVIMMAITIASMAIMAINGYDFFLASSIQTKMREMPKQLNLMPPHTNNVKTTPDVVPLIAARAVH